MQGVDTERLSIGVVALGTALAGLSGVVAAPLIALSPSMGSSILIESFIVVVTGGLSSFVGAFIVAIVIGQVHHFGVVYLTNVTSLITLLLMAGAHLWRPRDRART